MCRHWPVLEPDLDNPHVQAGVLTQLLSDVSGRLGAVVVGLLERLQLLGRDGGARPLVGLVTLQRAVWNIPACDFISSSNRHALDQIATASKALWLPKVINCGRRKCARPKFPRRGRPTLSVCSMCAMFALPQLEFISRAAQSKHAFRADRRLIVLIKAHLTWSGSFRMCQLCCHPCVNFVCEQ